MASRRESVDSDDKEMKRPIAILIALLILVAIIGHERIGSGLHFLISDDRTAGQPAIDGSTSPQERESRNAGPDEHERLDSLSGDPRSSEPDADDTSASRFNGSGDGSVVEMPITGEISPLHFIRSSSIVDSSEPSGDQIDRLKQSVALAAEGLRPGAIIFDADAISSSQAAVLPYARDEFDLTTHVKDIYDALENESQPLPKTANVEQGGGGQTATRPESK